jgi:hypothetical protein
MSRNFRLTKVQNLYEIADANLPAIHKVEQPEPGGIGEGGKQANQVE